MALISIGCNVGTIGKPAGPGTGKRRNRERRSGTMGRIPDYYGVSSTLARYPDAAVNNRV
ncbi:MAG: hypothetical protein AB1473_04605 [Thermodesulfobacteriota bacterium]